MGPCVEGGMFWATCGAMVFDWRVWLKKKSAKRPFIYPVINPFYIYIFYTGNKHSPDF